MSDTAPPSAPNAPCGSAWWPAGMPTAIRATPAPARPSWWGACAPAWWDACPWTCSWSISTLSPPRASARRYRCGARTARRSTKSPRRPAPSAMNCCARWRPGCRSSATSDHFLARNPMKDKCVLVTGATKGIGWALTQKLTDLGCHVVGIARNTDHIDFPGYLYACDLADAGRTEEVLREIREKFPVDAVVNNVGVVRPQPLGEIDLASLYNVMDLNVRVAVQVDRKSTRLNSSH